ncbi:FecCD family ABC transporter permease [Mangrovicoccus algicola]|uniref:Iron ABC transporter permease n=1 Tax=Mangrovicoccus algicola TaxID=2771008 RepID=A0A8J6YT81_9RHOB|nr:iron ABC transporter permease [Mangrovicoccus algicola]MBE3637195.1 iron ABC transporter permease [Mangrovicoccus algicola]
MRRVLLILAPAACAALVWWALGQGLTEASAAERLDALWPGASADPVAARLEALRLPRIGAALLAGAMISASGLLLQVVARNGLADPGLLGVSQGGVLAILAGAALFDLPRAALVPAGLFGAMATAAAVLLAARRSLAGGGLILVGIAVNLLLGSVTELIMTSGGMAQYARLAVWSRGSLAGVSAADLALLAAWAAVLLPLALLSGRWLDPLLLGDDTARSLGIETRLLLPVLVLLAAALAAPVVAVCGPVSFLGLIAGHVARRLTGGRMTVVLPGAMLTGSCVLLAADTAGRSLMPPVAVPAGIATSVGGFLVFVFAARLSQRGPAA